MPFDPTLDKTLHVDHVAGDEEAGNLDVELKVASYNGGAPKLQLTRVGSSGIHAKLGRMTKVEIERVRDKMTDILNLEIEAEKAATESFGGGVQVPEEDIPF